MKKRLLVVLSVAIMAVAMMGVNVYASQDKPIELKAGVNEVSLEASGSEYFYFTAGAKGRYFFDITDLAKDEYNGIDYYASRLGIDEEINFDSSIVRDDDDDAYIPPGERDYYNGPVYILEAGQSVQLRIDRYSEEDGTVAINVIKSHTGKHTVGAPKLIKTTAEKQWATIEKHFRTSCTKSNCPFCVDWYILTSKATYNSKGAKVENGHSFHWNSHGIGCDDEWAQGYIECYLGKDYKFTYSNNTKTSGFYQADATLKIIDKDLASLYGTDFPIKFYVGDTLKIADNTTAVYTGKSLASKVVVKNWSGKVVSSSNYVREFYSYENYDQVAKPTKVGKYTIYLRGKGDTNYRGTEIYAGKTLTIKPKKASIYKLTPGTGKLTVKAATKVSSTGGNKYQIQYRVNGTSTWKSVKTSAQTKTIGSLKKGKCYQVRIRAYKTFTDGINKTIYGSWSSIKTSAKIK